MKMAGEVEADSLADDSSLEVLSGTSVEDCLQSGFQRNVERRNLLNLTKLAVKSLIEASMSSGKAQDDSSFPLQQLFIVLEYVLRHRLKSECSPNNGFLTYPVLERALKREDIFSSCTIRVRRLFACVLRFVYVMLSLVTDLWRCIPLEKT